MPSPIEMDLIEPLMAQNADAEDAEDPPLPIERQFDQFLILDFESTCIKNMRINPQEIIEFPCLLVDAVTFETKSVFWEFVKPVFRPKLSPFCIKLTNITQEKLFGASRFSEVFQRFLLWLSSCRVHNTRTAFVTCGDWDLNEMLPHQCQLAKIRVPEFMKRWVNIKTEFERIVDCKLYYEDGYHLMTQMMDRFRMKQIGRLHSGRDDVENIKNVLQKLCQKGCVKANSISSARPREDVLVAANQDCNLMLIDSYEVQLVANEETHGEEEEGIEENIPTISKEMRALFANNPGPRRQRHDFFLVLHLQTTCLKNSEIKPREIIDFRCVALDSTTMEKACEFHAHVRPVKRPRLSPHCTEVTKVSQRMVDASRTFAEVYREFLSWLYEGDKMAANSTRIFITLGDLPLRVVLPDQCKLANINVDSLFAKWIDIKALFYTKLQVKVDSGDQDDLPVMQRHLGVKRDGENRADSVANIAKILSRFTELTPDFV